MKRSTMAVAGLELAGNTVLQGVLTGISLGLELTPVVGPFLQPIFVGIWDSALTGQTVAQKVVAMNALFESVQTITNEAIAENVADQVRACNASIAQLGQDYCDSVKAFKSGATSSDKVVVLFKNCKSTLEQMLDLCAQPSYMKHTVLSYGSALALYVGLLRDMMLAGADCGYSKSEIIEINNNINDCIKSAYSQTLCEAVTKLVIESGESAYSKVGSLVLNLGNLVGGLMTFNNEWHDGKACCIAKTHPNYDNCDFVDNTAHYQLTYRPKAVSTTTYNMPQVFMNGRAALHCFTDVDKKLDLAAFIVDEKLDMKLRAYYLVDNNDPDSSNVEVTISCEDNPKVHQVYLNKQEKAVVSCPWVKMYYSDTEGGPATTQYDKFSTAMTMRYDEYAGFQAEQGKAYTISTRASNSSTKNYYIIGFEIVPTSGPPDLLESVVTAIELTASAVVSGVADVVTGSLGVIGKVFHL